MVNDSEEIKKRRISTFLIGEKASHVKAVYGERNMVTNFDASPAADINWNLLRCTIRSGGHLRMSIFVSASEMILQ